VEAIEKAKKEETDRQARKDAIAARATESTTLKAAYDDKCNGTTPEADADCKTAKDAFDVVDL